MNLPLLPPLCIIIKAVAERVQVPGISWSFNYDHNAMCCYESCDSSSLQWGFLIHVKAQAQPTNFAQNFNHVFSTLSGRYLCKKKLYMATMSWGKRNWSGWVHKNKGKPYLLLHTHFDLSLQAIIYIKTSSYTTLCARDSVVLSGRSILILWLNVALERVTYSWPWANTGICKFRPTYRTDWPWALFMLSAKASHTGNCCCLNRKHLQIVFKSPVRSGYWVPNMVTETLTS